ncbi:hypothetical protein Fmac_003481 [Flemingia macrophylla]|uniref:SHSP domain-containing protein n=1 Tax=Flemingia macrophylla TaxID=520843 RepID=A0ABD1NMW1_9FABA
MADSSIENPLSKEEKETTVGTTKNLRRLPHVFTAVLELPFRADADIAVHEHPHCFCFVGQAHDAVDQVEAHVVHIHPGLTKLIVRESGLVFHEFDLDVWRIRLPQSTCPDLATAILDAGKLVVTVPKTRHSFDQDNNAVGAAATLFLVQ